MTVWIALLAWSAEIPTLSVICLIRSSTLGPFPSFWVGATLASRARSLARRGELFGSLVEDDGAFE